MKRRVRTRGTVGLHPRRDSKVNVPKLLVSVATGIVRRS